MSRLAWPLRAAVILLIGLWVSAAAAVNPSLSGSITLHFALSPDNPETPEVNESFWYYHSYSGGIGLAVPPVFDITAVSGGNVNWADPSNWTTYPLDLGLSIDHTGSGSWTTVINNGHANLNVLQGNGPTEGTVQTNVAFPTVTNGVGFTVFSNTVNTRYNVTLPTGVHMNDNQIPTLQNLTVNSGASINNGGFSRTIRQNLTNHGSGEFNDIVEGDFINDAVAASGNVANARYLQIGDQLVNAGELYIPQYLETLSATSNAGSIFLNGGAFYPQAAFANNGTFEFSAGAFYGPGVVTNNGTFDWSGDGHMSGNIVNATNSFTISGPNPRSLIGTLANSGTITQSGGHALSVGSDAILTNAAGALYDIIDDSSLYDGSVSGTINNAGTFRKSGGSGVSFVGSAFTNTGTITVASGTLRFLGGGILDGGTMSIADGTTVELSNGNFFAQGSNSASGNGALELTYTGNTNVIVANGNSASFENFTGGADLVLSGGSLRADAGGTLTLNLTGTSVVKLTGASGTGGGSIGGAGSTINSGNFEWTLGSVEGNLRNDSPNFTISGPDTHYIEGGNLANTSTITHSNDGEVHITVGGTLVNEIGALYDITGDADITSGFPLGTVTNAGTFRKSGGSGTTLITASFTNTGTLAADSGKLSFNGPDVLTLDSSGTLAFQFRGTEEAVDYGKVDVSHELAVDGILAISLEMGFEPTLGMTFDILDWQTISGEFDDIILPELSEDLTWNTSQLYVSGEITAGPAGDFNFDGVANAADYVMWRKTGGGESPYDRWRSDFGVSSESGSGSGGSVHAGVPEPSLAFLSLSATIVLVGALRPSKRDARRLA